MDRPPKKKTGPSFRISKAYEKLITDREPAHPIARLRGLFAVGLGRNSPISQAEFACWCGLSRESILIAEKAERRISSLVASRIFDLVGAELSWLQCKIPLEDFDYDNLQSWYPKTMPATAAKIDALQYGSSKSFVRTDFKHAVTYVIEALGDWSHRCSSKPRVPKNVLEELICQFGTSNYESQATPIWQAFAFAPNMTAVRVALEWGMLDEVPELKELPSAKKATNKELALLAHQLTVTLSKVERGEISL
jgi:hypothetical protein